MTNLAEAILYVCEIARQDERRKFKEYLEKKKASFVRGDYGTRVIDEIINELFGEK